MEHKTDISEMEISDFISTHNAPPTWIAGLSYELEIREGEADGEVRSYSPCKITVEVAGLETPYQSNGWLRVG